MATTNPVTITAPEGVPYIDITREFDAPVSAVFAAHSNPDLVKQWLGPNGYEMEIDEYEFVSGGRYKYVHRNPEGEEFRFNGVFHVVR
ncbi:SRPBCC domain-containing protein, partial [Streptomyces sp. AS02]